MTQATLEPQGETDGSSIWVRRTLLVIFCLGLFTAVGVVFTQVIAARVPEQRATLEKLITDRTGLEVRFDNVHFAWNLDGTSAVFERVELTDPLHGRVRVVAPELRVEFDTWDFLRHQQFSLGHVTLKSPDIDIIGDPEGEPEPVAKAQPRSARTRSAEAPEDEAALIRRFTSWAELMPIGRIEVEGARVHLFRRGERLARHDFTLSQAVVSRSHSAFNAFGTLLLSQDIGQSLFVSVKLAGASPRSAATGELRLIARRVLLDKLPGPAGRGSVLATRGRGTVDARFTLDKGRVERGEWQLSARELALTNGSRFDHFTVRGGLTRVQDDLRLDFTDLQVTRGARLARAPGFSARLSLAPGEVRVERATLEAERVPFMAAEFLAGALGPSLGARLEWLPAGWTPTAGELQAVKFDSRSGGFSAQVVGAELSRAGDSARLARLQAQISVTGDNASLTFDEREPAELRLSPASEPRLLSLSGTLSWRADARNQPLQLSALNIRSGEASLVMDGTWGEGAGAQWPLNLELTEVDRALLADLWSLQAADQALPLQDLQQGRIVTGKLSLQPMLDAEGRRVVNWARSRGALELAQLAGARADGPRLDDAAGKLEFSRVGTRLRLTSGRIDDLQLTAARIDWPHSGEPRLQVSLRGGLDSPLLRQTLADRDLERLSGAVVLEADARGEAAFREPSRWRINARVSDASIPLADDLPPVERLSGTLRLADGRLRGLTLAGSWLGGPVEIEARRSGNQGVVAANVSGVAEAEPLLKLLGQRGATDQVNGQVAWTGVVARESGDWRITLNGNLAGIESRLPEPFDKARGRALPVTAELRVGPNGIRQFEMASGRHEIRGRVDSGTTVASFDLQGVAGELHSADAGESRLDIGRLDIRQAPRLLATAGVLLAPETEVRVHIAELRQSKRSLGAVEASLMRRGPGVEYSLDSVAGSPHEISGSGACAPESGVDTAQCRLEFSLSSGQLPQWLAGVELPAEWPTRSLRAAGELHWRADPGTDIGRALQGGFELEAKGAAPSHQLVASATVADGVIELAAIQGSGPEPDQLFRGRGRISLQARSYDLALDYERMALAASAVPTPARARVARAWTVLRGSVAQGGWAGAEPPRRVQWHGTWPADSPESSD